MLYPTIKLMYVKNYAPRDQKKRVYNKNSYFTSTRMLQHIF